jgi:hypothetical protein
LSLGIKCKKKERKKRKEKERSTIIYFKDFNLGTKLLKSKTSRNNISTDVY